MSFYVFIRSKTLLSGNFGQEGVSFWCSEIFYTYSNLPYICRNEHQKLVKVRKTLPTSFYSRSDALGPYISSLRCKISVDFTLDWKTYWPIFLSNTVFHGLKW